MRRIGADSAYINTVKSDRHNDAYTGPDQARDEYLTTYDLTDELGRWAKAHFPNAKSMPYNEMIRRWCKRWFGDLAPERQGGGGRGYRIPLSYRLVARAWYQVENAETREAVKRVLLADPKDYVVVLDKGASTHYDVQEVGEKVNSILSTRPTHIQIIYVGDSVDGRTGQS